MREWRLSPYTTITVKNGDAVLFAAGGLADQGIGDRATLLVQVKPNRELDAFDAEFEVSKETAIRNFNKIGYIPEKNIEYLRYAMKRAVRALEDLYISPFARDRLIKIRNTCDHFLRSGFSVSVSSDGLRTFPGEYFGTQQSAVYRIDISPTSWDPFHVWFTRTSFNEFFDFVKDNYPKLGRDDRWSFNPSSNRGSQYRALIRMFLNEQRSPDTDIRTLMQAEKLLFQELSRPGGNTVVHPRSDEAWYSEEKICPSLHFHFMNSYCFVRFKVVVSATLSKSCIFGRLPSRKAYQATED